MYVCKKIGIDFDGWMPNAKSSYRKNKKHYSAYFNDNQIKIIQEFFKKEIDLLNYKFEKTNSQNLTSD